MPKSIWIAGLLVLAGCDRATATVDITLPSSEAAATSPSSKVSQSEASRPAESAPVTGTFAEQHFQALGTEPFWSIEVLGEKLLYSSPETKGSVAIAAHLNGMGTHGNGPLTYVGQMDGKPVELAIRKGQCSDGMSDTVYPYAATFTWGERTEQGCARLK